VFFQNKPAIYCRLTVVHFVSCQLYTLVYMSSIHFSYFQFI